MYAVIAYRWGLRDCHSYLFKIVNCASVARRLCHQVVDDRGGKYGAEVVDEDGKQIYYVESPYFGAAGNGDDPADRSK